MQGRPEYRTAKAGYCVRMSGTAQPERGLRRAHSDARVHTFTGRCGDDDPMVSVPAQAIPVRQPNAKTCTLTPPYYRVCHQPNAQPCILVPPPSYLVLTPQRAWLPSAGLIRPPPCVHSSSLTCNLPCTPPLGLRQQPMVPDIPSRVLRPDRECLRKYRYRRCDAKGRQVTSISGGGRS